MKDIWCDDGRMEVKMYQIAILYVCTGKYDVLWKDFYESCETYFLPDSRKEYFVFTDAAALYGEDNARVHKIYQKRLGWPNDTLMRFHMFSSITEQLRSFDYVFFMNANCLCVDYVREEDFLASPDELIVVRHPGFYNKKPEEFTYDRNARSKAYIPKGEGKYYICGGINGGGKIPYIRMIEELKKETDDDTRRGVVALWHDESHLNHYILEHENYSLKSPSYWYPEGWDIPFEPKIIVRDKSKWFDAEAVKAGSLGNRVKLCISRIKSKIAIRKRIRAIINWFRKGE